MTPGLIRIGGGCNMVRVLTAFLIGLTLSLVAVTATPAQQEDESEDLNCVDFETQEEAQAELDADPNDPFGLDPNGDSIACALLPSADDDASSEDADGGGGGNRQDRNQTDDELDGELTEDAATDGNQDRNTNRNRDNNTRDEATDDQNTDDAANENRRDRNRDNANNADASTEGVDVEITEDIDCIDFQFQEEAQAVLDDDASDPYNLDPSADGYACSELPSRSGNVRVTTVPTTGVGDALSHATLTTATWMLGLAALVTIGAFVCRAWRLRVSRGR